MKELLLTVERLRQHTIENIKSAMAKWAEKYTPEMKNIQCKLQIIKQEYRTTSTDFECELQISKRPRMTTSTDVVHYIELFGPKKRSTLSSKEQLLTNFARTVGGGLVQKILVEGSIGTGKTVLSKKIAWDWAKGDFTRFDIVFYLSLKLVQPSDSLEQAIIDQYKLDGVTVSKLRRILDKVGDTCLIILDGLDEHVQGWSSELMQTIRIQEYPCSNVLVTTQPEIGEIDLGKFFETVAKVEFSPYEELEKVVSNASVPEEIASNSTKIVQPNLLAVAENTKNPMVLMFLCILFDKNVIDCNTKTVSFGDLYAKVFELAGVNKEEMIVKGKAALEGIQKETVTDADSEMPHTTMRLYVAAYYVVQSLDDGQVISTLLGSQSKKPILLHNYLLLYFILWLLKEGKERMKLKDSDRLYNELISYVKDRVDFIQLDLVDIVSLYPAFDLSRMIKFNDNLSFQFIKDVLGNCKNIRELSFAPERRVEEILSGFFSKLRQVCVVDNINRMHRKTVQDVQIGGLRGDQKQTVRNGNLSPDIKIIMNYNASTNNEALLKFVHDSQTPFSLQLFDSCNNVMVDIADMMKRKMVQLHIGQKCFPFADKPMGSCEHLTHLMFTSLVQFREDVFSTLCDAVAAKKMPEVKYLSFSGCRDCINGKLGQLFKKAWPSLTHLNVEDCRLNEEDTKVICAAAQNAQKNRLPGLTSLVLSPSDLEIRSEVKLFERPWDKLLSLQLMITYPLDTEECAGYQAFLGGLKQGIFPNLVELGTTQWSADIFEQSKSLRNVSFGITKTTRKVDVLPLLKKCPLSKLVHINLAYSSLSSNLPYLVCQRFPSQESLVLAHTGLRDIRCLSQANAQDRFPHLRHLDVSKNDCFVGGLFEYESNWKRLEVLHVGDQRYFWDQSCSSVAKMIEKKCLTKLKELHVWFQDYDVLRQEEQCAECRGFPAYALKNQWERQMYCQLKVHERNMLSLKPDPPLLSSKEVLGPVAKYAHMMRSSSSLGAVYFYSNTWYDTEAEVEKTTDQG